MIAPLRDFDDFDDAYSATFRALAPPTRKTLVLSDRLNATGHQRLNNEARFSRQAVARTAARTTGG